jgi:hypothetical protein
MSFLDYLHSLNNENPSLTSAIARNYELRGIYDNYLGPLITFTASPEIQQLANNAMKILIYKDQILQTNNRDSSTINAYDNVLNENIEQLRILVSQYPQLSNIRLGGKNKKRKRSKKTNKRIYKKRQYTQRK